MENESIVSDACGFFFCSCAVVAAGGWGWFFVLFSFVVAQMASFVVNAHPASAICYLCSAIAACAVEQYAVVDIGIRNNRYFKCS